MLDNVYYDEIRNSKDQKKEKEFVLPNINTSVDNYRY